LVEEDASATMLISNMTLMKPTTVTTSDDLVLNESAILCFITLFNVMYVNILGEDKSGGRRGFYYSQLYFIMTAATASACCRQQV